MFNDERLQMQELRSKMIKKMEKFNQRRDEALKLDQVNR